MTPQPSDWRVLAAQASTEKDTDKLTALVMQLNQVLEREEKQRRLKYRNAGPSPRVRTASLSAKLQKILRVNFFHLRGFYYAHK